MSGNEAVRDNMVRNRRSTVQSSFSTRIWRETKRRSLFRIAIVFPQFGRIQLGRVRRASGCYGACIIQRGSGKRRNSGSKRVLTSNNTRISTGSVSSPSASYSSPPPTPNGPPSAVRTSLLPSSLQIRPIPDFKRNEQHRHYTSPESSTSPPKHSPTSSALSIWI